MPDKKLNSSYHMEAYKILVDLLKHDENLFWKRNDFMVAINGGLLTILGLLQSAKAPMSSNLKSVSLAMCLMGCLINILWLFVAKRSEAFYNHWYEQLELLERQHLNLINIFRTADEYFATGRIVLGTKLFELDFSSRFVRMFKVVQILTLIMAIVWFTLTGYLFF